MFVQQDRSALCAKGAWSHLGTVRFALGGTGGPTELVQYWSGFSNETNRLYS